MANSRQRRKRALIKLASVERDRLAKQDRIARDNLVRSNLASPKPKTASQRAESGMGFTSSVAIVAEGVARNGLKREGLYSATKASQVARPGYVEEGVKPVRIDVKKVYRGS